MGYKQLEQLMKPESQRAEKDLAEPTNTCTPLNAASSHVMRFSA
jgi:hypothetical protein